MANPYIHEFLFRGRPNGATEFHVYLGAVVDDPFTGEPMDPVLNGPLTLEQAAEKGFPLPSIIASINAQALNELSAARAEIEVLNARIVELTATAG